MSLLKHFHLLFIVIWIGSLLATTATVGYLAQKEPEIQALSLERWRRLYRWIDLPFMMLSLLSGLILFFWKGVSMTQGWLHLKLTAVFFLVVIDLWVGSILMRARPTLSPKKGVILRVLHGGVFLLPMVVLFSVYILKNK